MNQGGGLVLVVLGLAALYLAVTGKLDGILGKVQAKPTGTSPSGASGDGTTDAPYGINDELGTPRTRPRYDPNTPIKKRTSSTFPNQEGSVFADLSWPFVSTFSVN